MSFLLRCILILLLNLHMFTFVELNILFPTETIINKHNVFVYMEDRLYNSNAFGIFPKKTKMSDFVYFLMHVFLLMSSFCLVGSCASVESYVKNIVKGKLILN